MSLDVEASPAAAAAPGAALRQRVLRILWPSFLAAGALEMLVFAVVDPRELHRFGGLPIELAPVTVYSAAFLLFWCAVATAGALTALLEMPPGELDRPVHGR